jgi:nucleoside-diphosphate-sugar epimerase
MSQVTDYSQSDNVIGMTQQALGRQNGVFMKIVLIGANGKIGELVQKALAGAGHEIVKVGRKSGDFRVEIESRCIVVGVLFRSFGMKPRPAGDVAQHHTAG